MANNNVSLDWTGYESQEQAMDPNAVATFEHGRATFLDLDLKFTSVSQGFGTTFRVIFRPY